MQSTMGVLLLCLVAAACAMPSQEVKRAPFRLRFDPYTETWEHFKRDHDRKYETVEEEQKRYNVFMNNIQTIERHNWLYFKGEKSYYLGVNQFADMTAEEFSQYNMLRENTGPVSNNITCSKYLPPLNQVLPKEVDWRAEGFVTPIKNQKNCGSCWAFATTGTVEGQHFRKTGKLASLSEQQLVDCSLGYDEYGCGGGMMYGAYYYIHNAGGIETETGYPYTAKDDACTFNKSRVVAELSGCRDILSGSEFQLTQAVAAEGPVAVAIDCNHGSFQLYKGGVYDEPLCRKTNYNHAVLVVGYGTFRGQEYWLVKNSWGTQWGLEGYIMMSRNKQNQCGIATAASFPLV